MPTITRWFRVTHDINQDPEIWELRELYGDRAGFVWLECLSIADRNNGVLGPNSAQLHAVLAAKCRVYSPKVRSILEWCLGRGWLQVRSLLTPLFGTSSSEVRDYLVIAKWSKYNKTRETSQLPSETTPRLSRHDKTKKSIAPNQNFPEEWKWLEDMVRAQNSGFPIERFLDFAWWDAVSYQCGGLSAPFLEKEFAGMKRWIMDNPTRTPTPRGYRRFVASWLERAHDKERRFGNAEKR